MKTFKYAFGGTELTLRLDERQGTVADLLVDGKHPVPDSKQMPAYAAAIALALIEHEVEIVHDEEPGIITVSTQPSSWSLPAALMNNF